MLEQKKDTVYLEQWKFQINRLFQVKMNQVWFKKEKFKKKPIQSCLLPMPQNLPTANWFNSGSQLTSQILGSDLYVSR